VSFGISTAVIRIFGVNPGRGYAAGVDLWITLQGQGCPQAPHPLGQRKNGVAHIPTASAAAKDLFLKRLKDQSSNILRNSKNDGDNER
jgi:hypothetical protein